MADRYWVGGTGTWNSSNKTNWSTSSGGSGGASVPTSSDNVIFDSNSHNKDYTVTIGYGLNMPCLDLTLSNPSSGALTITTWRVSIYGSFYSSSGVTISLYEIYFLSTSTGKTITTNGNLLPSLYFNGVGGEWILQDNLTSKSPSNYIKLYQGTFDANGNNVKYGNFDSNYTTTRTLKMGSGTWEICGADNPILWDLRTTTNLTFDKGTSTIKFSGSLGTATRIFEGGGLTYYNFSNVVFTSNLTTDTGKVVINGSNTFNNFYAFDYVFSTRIEFTAGTTQTVSSFIADGTSSYKLTLQSSDTSAFTLSCPTGTIKCTYIDLSYSTATGGATWYALNSTDSGNNNGWLFSLPVTDNSIFFGMNF